MADFNIPGSRPHYKGTLPQRKVIRAPKAKARRSRKARHVAAPSSDEVKALQELLKNSIGDQYQDKDGKDISTLGPKDIDGKYGKFTHEATKELLSRIIKGVENTPVTGEDAEETAKNEIKQKKIAAVLNDTLEKLATLDDKVGVNERTGKGKVANKEVANLKMLSKDALDGLTAVAEAYLPAYANPPQPAADGAPAAATPADAPKANTTPPADAPKADTKPSVIDESAGLDPRTVEQKQKAAKKPGVILRRNDGYEPPFSENLADPGKPVAPAAGKPAAPAAKKPGAKPTKYDGFEPSFDVKLANPAKPIAPARKPAAKPVRETMPDDGMHDTVTGVTPMKPAASIKDAKTDNPVDAATPYGLDGKNNGATTPAVPPAADTGKPGDAKPTDREAELQKMSKETGIPVEQLRESTIELLPEVKNGGPPPVIQGQPMVVVKPTKEEGAPKSEAGQDAPQQEQKSPANPPTAPGGM